MESSSRSWTYHLERGDRRIELGEGETVLGRSRSAGVQVEDASVSRHHAVLSLSAGRVTVRDLGSSNGTQVNGATIDGERVLEDGDRVSLGESDFVFRSTPPPAPPAPPAVEATVRLDSVKLFCTTCGAALGELAEVCPRCGAAVTRRDDLIAGSPSGAAVAPSGSAVARSGGQVEPSDPPPTGAAAPAAAPDAPARELLPPLPELELSPLPPREESGVHIFLPAAGFWIRLAAYLVDGAWILLAGLLASFIGGGPRSVAGSLLGMTVTLILGAAVPLVGWTRWGTTPGKRLFGLYVCAAEGGVGIGLGKALLRWMGYLLSGALFGLGYLMIGFSASKQGLHDLLAGTYVGRRA